MLMMRGTTEQITDQFLLKFGTLTTLEEVHNTADTKYSVSPVAKIAVISKDRRDTRWVAILHAASKKSAMRSRTR